MAAGEAFLAMAGPVGWAIGGAALVGSGLMVNSKNKKVAQKAEVQTKQLKTDTEKVKELGLKVLNEVNVIRQLKCRTITLMKGKEIQELLREMHEVLAAHDNDITKVKAEFKKQLSSCSRDAQLQLLTLLNASNSLAERLEVKIA